MPANFDHITDPLEKAVLGLPLTLAEEKDVEAAIQKANAPAANVAFVMSTNIGKDFFNKFAAAKSDQERDALTRAMMQEKYPNMSALVRRLPAP